MTETVYFGTVFPLTPGATEPAYVYERRVDERGGAIVSTHITREPTGAIALADSATHASDYTLSEYTLHTDQLGRSGSIKVDGDRVTFRLSDGSGERTEVERQSGAVVVGPTLVGYVVRHLDQLRAGKTLSVRMAVLERMETIGFDLSLPTGEEGANGQTRIRMKPSSFFIKLAVDPIHFTFETASAKLVRLEGRVPSKVQKNGRWKDFDARVEYAFVAPAYR